MTALPSHVPSGLQRSADVLRKLFYIRILGYLVHHAPGDQGLKTALQEITLSDGDCALLAVGQMYYDHYIRAFRANKGRVPTPSNHASRPSFNMMADIINDTLVEAPQSHAPAKKNALIRDVHRCVITGLYDIRSVPEIRELQEKLDSDSTGSLSTGPTEYAHIFGESTNSDIAPASAKRNYAATMWAVMSRFGHETLPDDLNGPNVHRLENVMTVAPNVHTLFDQLMIWLTATGEENKYKLEGVDRYSIRAYSQYVTFTTPDPVKFPLPSPAYLAIHAACAKVAHLSGAAGCIDKFYQDMEDGTTLSSNGASASILEEAIRGLQVFGFDAKACV